MKSYGVKQLRRQFIDICRRAFSTGLQMSTGGNLSMRIELSAFLVKPSGKALCDLTPDELIVCDDKGQVLDGMGKPTKEFNSHLAIYQVRSQAGAIVHYHPPYATAYAVAKRDIPLPTVHARRILKRVPLISPPGEGSPELSLALGQCFSDHELQASLMAEHGIIVVGRDITEAQNLAELVEESARVAYLASCIAGFSSR